MEAEILISAIEGIDYILLLSERMGVAREDASRMKQAFLAMLKEDGLEAQFKATDNQQQINILKNTSGVYHVAVTVPIKANWVD